MGDAGHRPRGFRRTLTIHYSVIISETGCNVDLPDLDLPMIIWKRITIQLMAQNTPFNTSKMRNKTTENGLDGL
jgi:hypothetical protein